jgi:pimeloyl-ACP methyl ester carboxylesterase
MPFAIGPEGNRIAFEIEGDGPDIVLVHGITEDRSCWGAVSHKLAHDHRVISVDLRGHGESDPTATYPLDGMAADLQAVVEAAGSGLPSVVGHSLGGFVVSVYAAHHPVRAVVNVDQPLALAAFKDALSDVEPLLRGEAFPDVISAMFAPMMAALPESERNRIGTRRRMQPSVVLGIWDPVFTSTVPELDALVRAMVGGIDAPYLAIHGEEPGPAYRGWLEQVVPTARIEVWEGDAHYPHLVEPERFVARVSEFVR